MQGNLTFGHHTRLKDFFIHELSVGGMKGLIGTISMWSLFFKRDLPVQGDNTSKQIHQVGPSLHFWKRRINGGAELQMETHSSSECQHLKTWPIIGRLGSSGLER